MIAGQLRFGRAARLALLVGVVLGGWSLAVARTAPACSLAGGSLAAALAGLVAGWSLVGAGLAAWARRPFRRFGPLLVAAGLVWFLAGWDNPGIGVPMAFTAGLVLHAMPSSGWSCGLGVSRRAAAVPSGMGRGGDCL